MHWRNKTFKCGLICWFRGVKKKFFDCNCPRAVPREAENILAFDQANFYWPRHIPEANCVLDGNLNRLKTNKSDVEMVWLACGSRIHLTSCVTDCPVAFVDRKRSWSTCHVDMLTARKTVRALADITMYSKADSCA